MGRRRVHAHRSKSLQNKNVSKENGRESWWARRRATKSPSRSPAIHSTSTGTRTFGLRRHLHCLQAQTQSNSTPPSKIARIRIASAKWSLSLIHISEPTRLLSISYAVF